MKPSMKLTAAGLEELLRRLRPYGVRVVYFAGDATNLSKLIGGLIEDEIADGMDQEGLLAALKNHLIDIRGLPVEEVIAQIQGGTRTLKHEGL